MLGSRARLASSEGCEVITHRAGRGMRRSGVRPRSRWHSSQREARDETRDSLELYEKLETW